MKFKAKILGLCPERGVNYRTEVFVAPQVQKMTKKTSQQGSGDVEHYASQIIEIKRKEVINMFPDENLATYIKDTLPRKLLGALGDIRNYFNSKLSIDQGGTLGLKKPFEMAWKVKIHSIDKIGEIIPNGYVKRFQYKGGKGGMGTEHFDIIDEIEATITVINAPVKNQAPHIEKQAIEYLEMVSFGPGRHAELEILEILEE